MGYQSGYYNTTASYNTFIGHQSGLNNTTASYNTFIGMYAGRSSKTGSNNTLLGSYAGYKLVSGTGNVFLGRQAGYNETGSNKLYIDNSSTTVPLIYGNFSSNQLGVNTNYIPSGFAFAVKGKVISEEVKIKAYSGWSDFVFYEDYQLPTLNEVEKHIKEKGHLKDIPSAEKVKQEGFFLGEMDAKLLQKIEELTLYTIQQQKELNDQQKELEQEKKKNTNLEARLAKLEKLFLKE